ncbi:MAG: hypothetical protein LKJ25_09065 [Clostridia bacterium]|nr:hypothetical protein [Clostridia bacterium]
MSDNLKVTTPLSGYENSTKTNPISVNDTNISNITNIDKVTRQDGRTDGSDVKEENFMLYQNSNFDGFLKILKKMPSTTELLADLMFTKLGNLVTSGINENFAQEISNFLDMIKLSQNDLKTFIEGQAEVNTKFGGIFFDLLRNILSESSSSSLNLSVLEMLKKYNDFTSSNHILKSILADISNINKNMPARFSKNLMELVSHLDQNAELGDVSKNVDVLKKEIMPFLSEYIKNTNDFGTVRNLISYLTLNIARYENADKKAFAEAFKEVMSYNDVKRKFGDVNSDKLIEALLKNSTEKLHGYEFNDKLMNIIERGIKGEAGYENIDSFKDILSSMLINESVYMPLIHIMLPLNVENNMMYSEIWIDPDDKSDKNGKESLKEYKERKTKLLVKFDIKNVGFFDLIILHQKSKIDMQIFCPEKIIKIDKTIKSKLKEIIEKNGLTTGSISVGKSNTPVSISEVFPKIYERKNTVNVRV